MNHCNYDIANSKVNDVLPCKQAQFQQKMYTYNCRYYCGSRETLDVEKSYT